MAAVAVAAVLQERLSQNPTRGQPATTTVTQATAQAIKLCADHLSNSLFQARNWNRSLHVLGGMWAWAWTFLINDNVFFRLTFL